jgi:flavodoxin
MSINQFPNRRETIFGLAMSLAGGIASAGTAEGDQPKVANKKLVAYLSRSGNTRVVAGQLQRRFSADLFEIRMAVAWPDDYEEMVAWASRLRESGETPRLAESVTHISNYDTIFLGSPIWGSALPAPVRTFLTTRDLSGKTLVPFLTYGCCGAGNAPETIAQLAPKARILKPFILKCDQERDTLNSVAAWLESTKVPASNE